MSAEAVGHVYRKSPYKGALLAVHHAIADSANDQHHYEFFMAQGNLATKARISRESANRALARLVEDGWLTIVEDGPHLPRGIVRYRFEFHEDAEDVYAPARRPVTRDHTSGSTCDRGAQDRVTGGHTEPKGEPKTDTRVQRTSAVRATDPVLDRQQLAANIKRARADLKG